MTQKIRQKHRLIIYIFAYYLFFLCQKLNLMTLGTTQAFICNSRPRRFGKSMTANMLSAYYSKGCDSHVLFDGLKISGFDSYDKNLNKYDVIHIDVQAFLSELGGEIDRLVSYISSSIVKELIEYYPNVIDGSSCSLFNAIASIYNKKGVRFIFIIDEWDVILRDDNQNKKIQDEYILFLRGLFKGTEPSRYILLAYLTGILPIKKEKTQSAMNNFREYSMLNGGPFSEYVGFTEIEVMELAKKYNRDFNAIKEWYDGYLINGYSIYNPNSVVNSILDDARISYWSSTALYDAITPLIDLNFDGLKSSILDLLAGNEVRVDVGHYNTDTPFKNKDDVLTYLIYLGYLSYNQQKLTVFIPNEEVRQELFRATSESKWNDFFELEKESEKILFATVEKDSCTVKKGIEKIHSEYSSIITYNNENSLSCILTISYLASLKYYYKPIREFPTGKGYADFVYLPRAEYRDEYPSLVIELKWNTLSSIAIDQIKEKKYPNSLLSYSGAILLVAISYDKKNKEHSVLIEEFEK